MRDECCLSTRPHTFVFIWCCMFPSLIELYKPHNYTQFLTSCSVHLFWAPLIRCLQILRQPPMFLLSALVANMASPFWFGVTTSTAWEPVWPKKNRSSELNDPWIGRLMQLLKNISGEELDYKMFFQNGIYHPGQCLGQNRFETTSIWGEFTLEAEFPTALIHEPFGFRPRFSEVTIWWNEMSLQLFKMYCHGNLLYLIAYKLFIKQWSNKIRTCLLEMDISLVHTCLGNGFFLYPFIPSFFAASLVVVRGLRFWLFFLETTMLDPVSLLGNVHDCQIGNLGPSRGWDL